MKLIVGMPVMSRAWCLPQWFERLDEQGVEYQVVAVLSPSNDNTEEILIEHGADIFYDDRPGRVEHENLGHVWGQMDTYHYMAGLRNGLLETVSTIPDLDYFFSLDSDIMLPKGGLRILLDHLERYKGVISPAVNMAQGTTVWNCMDWDPHLPDNAVRRILPPKKGRKDVIMAAMLMDKEGMTCRWRAHPAGEDVGFCLDARDKEVPLWWLPDVKCNHLMRRY